MKRMKSRPTGKQSVLVIIAVVAIALLQYLEKGANQGTPSTQRPATVEQKINPDSWSSGQWATVSGTVKRTLADDNDGFRHQRFILAVPGGKTLLVAHNIDLAERVPLKTGDQLSLHGRYETNDRGGVMHWTHHDPDGSTSGGWIEFNGKRYR
jgi:Protein of unknown function (DUF3465)